jgi:hypothetical protein
LWNCGKRGNEKKTKKESKKKIGNIEGEQEGGIIPLKKNFIVINLVWYVGYCNV